MAVKDNSEIEKQITILEKHINNVDDSMRISVQKQIDKLKQSLIPKKEEPNPNNLTGLSYGTSVNIDEIINAEKNRRNKK